MNVTTGTELGGYAFRDWGSDPIIFGVPYSEFTSTTVLLEADFLATDVYKLTLHSRAGTGDRPQSPNAFLQISGLEVVSIVPEPTILSMVGFGLLVGLSRRRR